MLLALFVSLAVAQTQTESPIFTRTRTARPTILQGVAVLLPTIYGPGIAGNVTFAQSGATTTVTAYITGLAADSVHGMHVHAFGNMAAPASNNGLLASGHYNPLNVGHQCPGVPPRHVGDMGNWTADASGVIWQTKTLDLLNLDGAFSIIGRSVILHATSDDCTGTTGNAGSRLAQGVIGIANVLNNVAVQGNMTGLEAHAVLVPTANSTISGLVTMKTYGNGLTWIYAEIKGMVPGANQSWHIHQYGDIRGPTGLQTGGHYNPHNVAHGLPPASVRHVGDLGNLPTARADGRVFINMVVDIGLISVENVYGRGFIVHQLVDSGVQPTGNAGARWAQGVIGLAALSTVGCRDPDALNFDPTAVTHDVCSYQLTDFTPAGGVLEFPYRSGNVRVEVPASAVSSSIEVSLQNLITIPPPPTSFVFLGDPFLVNAAAVTLQVPASVSFTPYSLPDQGAIVEMRVVSNGAWVPLNATYFAGTNTFTTQLNQLPATVGAFIVGHETQSPVATASATNNDTGAAWAVAPSLFVAFVAALVAVAAALF
eukprot:TRINITY_DN198_c0_g1_i4.p1 TRINITY_DN198_c0_g1~~TRINITY_DN198_c0_g1_i4.p1  ORF type:complete len:559 (-),score=121.19 TRINITY_DN198_c0_g1_i4:51-1673(-)